MAKLDFSLEGYEYHQGLKAIELMWVAANLALKSRENEVLQEISEYRNHVDAGGEPIGEWDGPDRLWDHEDELRLQVSSLAEAATELSRATAIALYHHWERFVPNGGQGKFRKHDDLVGDLTRAGIAVHADIDALRFAANFLKHGNVHWLKKLYGLFPERFPELAAIGNADQVWWGTLIITKVHVEWFLEVANTSKRPFIAQL